MRYGLIRRSPGLPPPNQQRRLIEATGCDVWLEEGPPSPGSQRALFRLLNGLELGDEVVAYSLDAFEATTGELTRMIRRFFETGVKLRFVGGSQLETLAPNGGVPRVLALLADHETRRPSRAPTRRRARPEPDGLSRHQVSFAREMRRRGHSLREIGLVFRLSPNEISDILGEGRP
ncbi:MAG: hypothetical protein GC203_15165 [Phenylobacterium sp.]|uniref:recombinase family protein n=1 Tax=Phenylobacterium sp. TaxID=1871053 RepID=UPI0025CC7893|nr:recombinase family protein [Phenylobacterium sp.]MBI1199199.1 hypothetical protein [Phenylobacterium sp.]